MLKSYFSKTSFRSVRNRQYTLYKSSIPKFFFCNKETQTDKDSYHLKQKLDEYFTNDICLILKAQKKSKLQNFISHSLLFSVFGASAYKLVYSLLAMKILPSLGWGILTLLSGSMNYNFHNNKSNTVESIALSRKKIGEDLNKYTLEITTMKNFNNIVKFDLDNVEKIEEKKIANYSNIFTILVINDKNYFMIPTKICLICNEDLYSQLMTGRIKDIF